MSRYAQRLTDEQLASLERYGARYSPGDELATRILQAVEEIKEARRTTQTDGVHPLGRIFADVMQRAYNSDTRRRMRLVQAIVAEEYEITTEALIRGMDNLSARARRVAMYFSRVALRASTKQIGHVFERHHSTVIHGTTRPDAAFLAEFERVRPNIEAELDHRLSEGSKHGR